MRRQKILSTAEKILSFASILFLIAIVVFFAFQLFYPTPSFPTFSLKWMRTGCVYKVAFSPKVDLLAAYGYIQKSFEREVRGLLLFSTSSGQLARSIGAHANDLSFSPDGRLLAASYQEQGMNKVDVFNVADGRKMRTIVMGKSLDSPSVTFASDGRLAIVHNGKLWFVEVDNGERIQTKIQATEVAFSPDGRFIAACWKNWVSIFDGKGKMVRKLEVKAEKVSNTNASIRKLSFSRDGKKFVVLWLERKQVWLSSQMRWWVSVWGTSDWELEHSLPMTHFQERTIGVGDIDSNASLVAVSDPFPRRVWLFGIFSKSLIAVYRLEDGQVIARLPRYGFHENDVAFSPTGRYLAVAHVDGIELWEFKAQSFGKSER